MKKYPNAPFDVGDRVIYLGQKWPRLYGHVLEVLEPFGFEDPDEIIRVADPIGCVGSPRGLSPHALLPLTPLLKALYGI